MTLLHKPVTEIKDYLLEEWIRCPYKYVKKNVNGRYPHNINWRQRVQYSVNHIIHDFCMLPDREQSESRILESAKQRWTNKVGSFYSDQHYRDIQSIVTSHLVYFLLQQSMTAPPMILFEKYSVWIDELKVQLTMIFQQVQGTENSYVIKKYLVDEDPDVIEAYKHMTVTFCHHAFPTLPERMDVYLLQSGTHLMYTPTLQDVRASVDYLRITHRLFDEAGAYTKQESLTECRTCPFRRECSDENTTLNQVCH